jgi:hypothetical protein
MHVLMRRKLAEGAVEATLTKAPSMADEKRSSSKPGAEQGRGSLGFRAHEDWRLGIGNQSFFMRPESEGNFGGRWNLDG